MALAEPFQTSPDDPADDHLLDPETEAAIDAALERARLEPELPTVVEAVFHPGPVHNYLMVRLSDGRRLLIPREMLTELAGATDEELEDIRIPQPATFIYWPQLDEGLHVHEFLAHRWPVAGPGAGFSWPEERAA